MRALTAAALAASLMISPALAVAADAPLAPGKPAGTQDAQLEAGGVLLVVGILAAAGIIAAIASTTQGSGATTPPATTTTH